MRKAFINYECGNPVSIALGHVHHCFDAIRQDVMCNADDTPMPTTELPAFVGDGQTRMCRNFDQFISWTKEPERHACYHRWTDYAPPTKKIEMFGFCPEDSEYYPVMNAYFEKWGHHDPYEGYVPHEWHDNIEA